MALPLGNFGDLGRLNVEGVTGRLQEMGISMDVREVMGQMGRRISLTVSTGLVSIETFTMLAIPGTYLGGGRVASKTVNPGGPGGIQPEARTTFLSPSHGGIT